MRGKEPTEDIDLMIEMYLDMSLLAFDLLCSLLCKDQSCEGFAGFAIIVDIPAAALSSLDSFTGASRQEGRGFDPGAGQKIFRSLNM